MKTTFPYFRSMPRLTDEQRATVEQHMGLLHQTVRAHRLVTLEDFSDYLQAGCIGLMRAVQMFDPDNGAKFSTYAVPWIRASINYALEVDNSVHVPRNIRDKDRIISSVRMSHQSRTGQTATPEEVHDRTGLSIEKVNDIDTWMVRVSLSTNSAIRLGDNDSDCTLQDRLTYQDCKRQDDLLAEAETSRDVNMCVSKLRKTRPHNKSKLPSNIKEIVARRCLMDGERQADVARDYGVSRERIRQLKFDAITELRRMMKEAV